MNIYQRGVLAVWLLAMAVACAYPAWKINSETSKGSTGHQLLWSKGRGEIDVWRTALGFVGITAVGGFLFIAAGLASHRSPHPSRSGIAATAHG